MSDSRCRRCGAVFNLFTHTLLAGSRYLCTILVQLRKGVAQGTASRHLALEVGRDRGPLVARRHAMHTLLEQRLTPRPWRIE